MTPRERAAIALARRALSSIEGTWLVRELDAVLSRAHAVLSQDGGVQLALSPPRYDPEILRVLHQGVTTRRKLRVETLRWVLRWGKGAEVRAPEALRELVRQELAEALAAYGRASRGVAPARHRARD